jgi:hypothetical protein
MSNLQTWSEGVWREGEVLEGSDFYRVRRAPAVKPLSLFVWNHPGDDYQQLQRKAVVADLVKWLNEGVEPSWFGTIQPDELESAFRTKKRGSRVQVVVRPASESAADVAASNAEAAEIAAKIKRRER